MALFGFSGALLLILSVVQASGTDTAGCECPPLWTRYGDNCYRYFGTPTSWKEAENHCKEFFTRYGQGHLTSVQSQGENDFLQAIWRSSFVHCTNTTTPYDEVWIGLNDRAREGKFAWSDRKNVGYTDWNDGQPNGQNKIEAEDCVAKFEDSEWYDRPCEENAPYICKV